MSRIYDLSKPEVEDYVYEAAVVPDLWPGILQDISDTISANGALIFGSTDMGNRHVVSPGIMPGFQTFVSEGWHLRNTRNDQDFGAILRRLDGVERNISDHSKHHRVLQRDGRDRKPGEDP